MSDHNCFLLYVTSCFVFQHRAFDSRHGNIITKNSTPPHAIRTHTPRICERPIIIQHVLTKTVDSFISQLSDSSPPCKAVQKALSLQASINEQSFSTYAQLWIWSMPETLAKRSEIRDAPCLIIGLLLDSHWTSTAALGPGSVRTGSQGSGSGVGRDR